MKKLILFSSILLILVINDQLRLNSSYIYKNLKTYCASILISTFIGAILVYFVGGYIGVYQYVILMDIAFLKNEKAMKYLYILNIFLIIFILLLRITLLEGIGILQVLRENILDFLMVSALLFFNTTSVFSYRALIIEKNRVEKLNEEIEKLTIEKERNRVAQEIHDNLGHNLVALNMNLDVVGNMLDEDNEIEDIILRCQRLTKNSMENLRKVVYALKDEELSQGFIVAIENLIHNIDDGSNIRIVSNIDENIENYSPEYKNIIYTTIKESITNSIKHGKCSEIEIDLKIEDEIFISIKDDGVGCEEILKGNGLIGIEGKMDNFGGKVLYIIEEGDGFEIIVKLPIEDI
ncbi:MAG: hypothetical protein GX023_05630 [Tissierellia bacterium]|nr:hypothetical protein [Tissierellia bacterium]